MRNQSAIPGCGAFILVARSIVLLAGIWLSTGTMALYGATLDSAIITTPCHYLVNIDHTHFKAVFLMLEGAPREQWDWSVYLRRVLHPLLGYPLMKLYGFELGGVILNVILQVAAFFGFGYFLRHRFGDRVAILGIWLLSLYPGIHYWVGLPYSHATIVPWSIFGMMILWYLAENPKVVGVAFASLLMGVFFLSYDLFPFLGLAAVLILLAKRRFLLVPVAVGMLAVPSLVWNLILSTKYQVSFVNSSTAAYPNIIHSYLSVPDFAKWWALLREFPVIAIDNYFFSNFLFLPLLFLALFVCGFVLGRIEPLALPEIALLASGLLLFLFLNLAPPYPGWQMRGTWIPRLYQPVFVAILIYSARTLGSLWTDRRKHRRAIAVGLFAVTLAGNAAVVFGPKFHSHFSSIVYARFYKHATPNSLYVMLSKYGRRPLGFCDASLPPPTNPYNVEW